MMLFGDSLGHILHEASTDFSWVAPLVLMTLIVTGVAMLWHGLVIDPREAKIKLAAEQTKKAKLDLQRERLRRRRRKPKVADDIEVIDDGDHKREIVEEPKRKPKRTAHDEE